MEAREEFLDSLPENENIREILLDFVNALRWARSLDEVNIYAGLAWQRLEAQRS